MSKWKDTSKHWSKTSKREEVLAKCIIPLKNKRYDGTGISRSKETKEKISKSRKGKGLHSVERKDKAKVRMAGNTRGFKKGMTPWNKGLVGFMAGEKNARWAGGVSTEREKNRHTVEMRLWRKSVLERDNFTCQKYGVNGGWLQVHHINNFSYYPELRTAIDNGITLSEKAHKEFHQLYGRYNNTKEQINEFLTWR
jgi:hypothetical protein